MVNDYEQSRLGISGRADAKVPELLLLALGFGCLIGFSRMSSLGFSGYLTQGAVPLMTDSWYALRSAVCLATLALLAVSGWFRWFQLGKAGIVGSAVVAGASVAIFAIDVSGSFGWLVAVLGGSSSSALMFAWMLLLSRHGLRDILAATLAGFIVAEFIVFACPLLEPTWSLAMAVLAAFGVGACYLAVDKTAESARPDGSLSRAEGARVPWLTIVMLASCEFLATMVFGIAQHLAWLYDWSPNGLAFSVAFVAVLVTTMALMAYNRGWMHLAWIPYFMLFLLALLLSCIAARGPIQVAIGFLMACVCCSLYLHWAVVPAILSKLQVPRSFLVGLVLMLTNGALATLSGDALGASLPHSMQNLGGVAGMTVIALAIVFVGAFLVYRHAFGAVGFFGGLLTESHAVAHAVHEGDGAVKDSADSQVVEERHLDDANAEDANNVADEPDPLEALRVRLDGLTDRYGLTPREAEVALLTVQGFSCSYIAEKLVVSNSTVRFHQQNLYRKFDVHSRNELIEAVNAPDGSSAPVSV